MSPQRFLELGYPHSRQLPNGQWLAVAKMAFTAGLFVLDDDPETGYKTRYCYEHLSEAVAALTAWDGAGDPPGPWIKQKPEGRLNPNIMGEDNEANVRD